MVVEAPVRYLSLRLTFVTKLVHSIVNRGLVIIQSQNRPENWLKYYFRVNRLIPTKGAPAKWGNKTLISHYFSLRWGLRLDFRRKNYDQASLKLRRYE